MPQPAPSTAIVTGAGAGIGLALAQQLIERGYLVAAVDRNAKRLADAADRLGPRFLPYEANVADADAWQTLIQKLRLRWRRLDLLVNNAGVLAAGELSKADTTDSQSVIAINLTGTLLGCQLATPWLIESVSTGCPQPSKQAPRPGIINVASIFATAAPPGFAAYSASKAGVVALSESLRGELAPHGLNLTVALPGTTPTSLFTDAAYSSPRFAEVIDQHQQTSVLTPDSVAQEILAAAARGRMQVVVGRRARRVALLKRLLPETMRRRIASEAAQELGASANHPRPKPN